jgi:hypothetical protein
MNLYRRKLEKIANQIDKLATKGKDNYLEYHKYIDELINKGDYATFEEVLSIFYQIDVVDARYVSDIRKTSWNEICFQTKASFLTKLSKVYNQRNVYQQSYNVYSSNVDTTQISLSNPLSTTYSTTGLTPSILLNRVNDVINIEFYEPTIYSTEIYRSTWVDGSATQSDLIQRITVTQSTYTTQIPITHGRDYLITTYQRDTYPNPTNYNIYNYQFTVSKDPLLGQIVEMEQYSQDVKYLMQNKQYARIIGERKTYLEVSKVGATYSVFIDYENPSWTEDQNLLQRYKLALDVLQS